MNFVLYDRRELTDDGIVEVVGDRARHLLEVVKVAPGDTVRTLELGIGRGLGEVVSVAPGLVRVRPQVAECDLHPPRLDLIVALPRPQSVKKILEVSATVGVTTITFIAGERVEQSYFSSSVLTEESVRHHLRLGMEQGGNPFAPELHILPWFRPAALLGRQIEHSPAGRPSRTREAFERLRASWGIGFLLHPPTIGADDTEGFADVLAVFERGPNSHVGAVIGPEGGWTPPEVAAWSAVGCEKFSLGSSVVRVETAVTMLVAQISTLRRVAVHNDANSDGVRRSCEVASAVVGGRA